MKKKPDKPAPCPEGKHAFVLIPKGSKDGMDRCCIHCGWSRQELVDGLAHAPVIKSDAEATPAKEEQWAIVEILGHSRYAGTVSEHQIGGCSFVRVDIPEIDGTPAFTKLFGNAAIYSITPVSEQIARLVAREFQSRPLTVYIRELEEDVRRRRLKAVGEEEDL